MSTKKLTNLPLKDFRRFLKNAGCQHLRDKGGHEIWTRSDLTRPIVIQSHIDPIPAKIIRTNLKTLGLSKSDFFEILDGKKKVVKDKDGNYVLKEIGN